MLARMGLREDFTDAADAFADQVARLPEDVWDAPGLGTWSVRELVGHTASSVWAVPDLLAHPAEEIAVPHDAVWYALRHRLPPELVASLVAAAGEAIAAETAALGDDPRAAVVRMVADARHALAGAGDDDVVTTAAGGMRFADWLPTRVLELTVHALDLQDATGVAVALPPGPLATAASLAVRTAVEIGDGPAVLRGLTGRASLPAGYSAL